MYKLHQKLNIDELEWRNCSLIIRVEMLKGNNGDDDVGVARCKRNVI
jgi:hypothetical protein